MTGGAASFSTRAMPALDFKGKSFIYTHHLGVPYRELLVVPEKSCVAEGRLPDLDDNLILHGDNLEALKALLPRYAGRVDCIYIDPPYNTGTEGWCYNDAVNAPLMREWLKKEGNPVEREDLQRHDKWLCMMWPRLQLLKELLAEDGAIFVSIDDNEVHRLRDLMDEIFGEENFLGLFPRRTKAGGGSASSHFAIEHDYVLIYAKTKEELGELSIEHDPEYAKRYSEEDEDGRYYWDTFERSYTATTPYEITAPDGSKLTGNWFRAETRFKADLKKGDMRFKKKTNGTWSVQFKQRMPIGRKLRSLLTGNEFKSAPEELEQMSLPAKFDYPKPVSLIAHLLTAVGRKNALILDSYAGSGTTAHAVLALNAKDGGKRRFILVQCDEYDKEKRELVDLCHTLTAERVRRVIRGYDFTGTQETELHPPEKVTWTTFAKDAKRNEILERIEATKTLYGANYEKIETKIEDGVLTVVGKKTVEKTMPGLGGSFTYVELGEPMDLERLLAETPGSLPAFASLARYLFHTATGRTLPDGAIASWSAAGSDSATPLLHGRAKSRADAPPVATPKRGRAPLAPALQDASDAPALIGETEVWRIYMHYRPDEAWLRSPAAALTRSQCEAIAEGNRGTGKQVLIFAASKYVTHRSLRALNVDFAQLPYSLHRVQSE